MKIVAVVVYEQDIEASGPYRKALAAGGVMVELSGRVQMLELMSFQVQASETLTMMAFRTGFDEGAMLRFDGPRTDVEELLGRPAVVDPA